MTGLSVGVWATLFPRSFYDSFPGFHRIWVGVDGPYNEHLARDVGSLYLALTVTGVPYRDSAIGIGRCERAEDVTVIQRRASERCVLAGRQSSDRR